jgi:uncharacterized protein involved in tolerance to divalent cations
MKWTQHFKLKTERAACFLLLFLHFLLQNSYSQTLPLKHAHAHNDYLHKHSLFDALDNGFTSIEVDVYLHKGKLKVSHLPFLLHRKKTLEELYLQPLRSLININGGSVYAGMNTPIVLMIDFKTEADVTYAALCEVMKPYSDLITLYKHDSISAQGPINVLISGRSPISQLLIADSSYASIDGSISIIKDTVKRKVCTRFSDAWSAHFTWKGEGEMAEREMLRLKEMVKEAHALQKEIRFYHLPDKPQVWKVLLENGVDWINTDKLSGFRQWFTEQKR